MKTGIDEQIQYTQQQITAVIHQSYRRYTAYLWTEGIMFLLGIGAFSLNYPFTIDPTTPLPVYLFFYGFILVPIIMLILLLKVPRWRADRYFLRSTKTLITNTLPKQNSPPSTPTILTYLALLDARLTEWSPHPIHPSQQPHRIQQSIQFSKVVMLIVGIGLSVVVGVNLLIIQFSPYGILALKPFALFTGYLFLLSLIISIGFHYAWLQFVARWVQLFAHMPQIYRHMEESKIISDEELLGDSIDEADAT